MRDELTCVIVTKCDACGDVAIECSARCTNRLTKRVDRFAWVGPMRRACAISPRSLLVGGASDHCTLHLKLPRARSNSPILSVHQIWGGSLFLSDEFSDPENALCVLVQRECSPNRIGGHGGTFHIWNFSWRTAHLAAELRCARSVHTGHRGDTSVRAHG